MTNVTCRLTTKKPGSAPCPTLVIEYWITLLLCGFLSHKQKFEKADGIKTVCSSIVTVDCDDNDDDDATVVIAMHQ